MSSNSTAEVVPVVMQNHPDADSLSLVSVYGFTVVVRTTDWLGVEKAVYITPDTIVDTTRPEFSFLASDTVGRTKERVKVKKLRGVISMGLLIPAPEGANIGDDLWEELGLERYEPIAESKDSDCVKAPTAFVPKYDIDNFYRYKKNFIEGEALFIQEKLNGCFHADTLVKTRHGSVKIKDIGVGQKILSYNLETKEFEEDEILEKLVGKKEGDWVEIVFEDDRKLICTENHLILTTNGYVKAVDLSEKDDVVAYL